MSTAASRTRNGGKLTETVVLRLSRKACTAMDRQRNAGLFERSRSEFLRDALEAYLTAPQSGSKPAR